MGLSECILVEVAKDQGVTREELALRLDASPNTVKEHLAKLKDDGRIKRVGSRKSGHWEVI